MLFSFALHPGATSRRTNSPCRSSANAVRTANATSSASHNLDPGSGPGASNNNFYPIERPAAAKFVQQISTPELRLRARPPVSPATTPLRAAPPYEAPLSRNALLAEVISSPQRIENAIGDHTLDSDEEESSVEISEVSEDPVSPPRAPAQLSENGLRTPPSAANQALVMAQTSGVFESSPAHLPPVTLGAADRNDSNALRAVLFDPSDQSPPPNPLTPEKVKKCAGNRKRNPNHYCQVPFSGRSCYKTCRAHPAGDRI